MTTEPRAALDRLIAAFESHLDAARTRRGEADQSVVQAYQTLADAFLIYDDALYDAYDEVTPLVLVDEDEGDDIDEDDLDEDDLDGADVDDELDDGDDEDDDTDDENDGALHEVGAAKL